MPQFTIGSLFDGSGGFPLAASLCGIVPTWASEVEPYPIAVTRSRFPDMVHLGDISKVNGATVHPVDVISFGSPCQDMSVAGKRAGIKHQDNGDEETTRSGLFIEAVRIIKEMRKATNGKYPTFAIWENVPGAFSSNKGEDFRLVLEELAKIVEPRCTMPAVPKGGWPYADRYMGDGWSIAYRTFDAQFWGVPQRRRRIYLVADFGGRRAGEILFERESLRGYFAEGRTPWQGTASDAERGVATADREIGSLSAREQYLFENHSQDTRFKGPLNVCPMLPAQLGTGGNNTPFVVDKIVYESHPMGSRVKELDEIAPTVTAKWRKGGADTPLVVEKKVFSVRRLTPTECARLQGFPDHWGDVDPLDTSDEEEVTFWIEVYKTFCEINGRKVSASILSKPDRLAAWHDKLHTDSAEYKMWGNGIALPNALYVMQGVADALMR